MGKKIVLVVVSLLLFGISPAAAADGALGLKLGYARPTGDLADSADGALAFGVYGSRNITRNFALQLSYLRHKHNLHDDTRVFNLDEVETNVPIISSKDLVINEFVFNGTFTFDTMWVKPYLLAGGGVYVWDATVKGSSVSTDGRLSSTSNSTGSTDVGLNVGGGLHYMFAPNFSFGAEATYTYIYGDFDKGYFNFLGTLSIWP